MMNEPNGAGKPSGAELREGALSTTLCVYRSTEEVRQ